ncbi:MAG: sigma-70 family RNA polymerase sigma factor [Gemmataceae bacterium]|nr:sigma-70 family RNA polymerase sigma factor [Gemmataceae bacterium]
MDPQGWNDSELADRVKSGNEDAARELVRRFAGRMFAVTRRYCANEEDARESLQDAFASAFRAIGSFHGDSQLGTWLHTIAVNSALMKLRRARSRPEVGWEDLQPQFQADGHYSTEIRDWSPQAISLAEREETRNAVRSAIDQLPESYRTVLLLRDIEEWGTADTAQKLGVSEAVVKTRLHRARAALRTLLTAIFEGGRP